MGDDLFVYGLLDTLSRNIEPNHAETKISQEAYLHPEQKPTQPPPDSKPTDIHETDNHEKDVAKSQDKHKADACELHEIAARPDSAPKDGAGALLHELYQITTQAGSSTGSNAKSNTGSNAKSNTGSNANKPGKLGQSDFERYLGADAAEQLKNLGVTEISKDKSGNTVSISLKNKITVGDSAGRVDLGDHEGPVKLTFTSEKDSSTVKLTNMQGVKATSSLGSADVTGIDLTPRKDGYMSGKLHTLWLDVNICATPDGKISTL